MAMLYDLFSTRLLIKIIVVPILCLTSGIVSAQLEFSNWIIGKNTIMHLEPDGTTSLVNQNGIIGDKYFHTFNSLLSDNNGNPIVKIGERIWRYENGVVIGSIDGVCALHHINGEPIFENEPRIWTPPTFMLKSPDNKYSYILHSTFSYEWSYESKTDSLIRTGKTQIRCFCKNNLDKEDKGKDFIIHEYTNIEYFKDVIYGNATGGEQDPYLELPFFAGMSHTDGKSIWVITKSNYEDSVVAINLNGSTIKSKKKSYLHLGIDDIWAVPTNIACYNITDNGKIFVKVPNQPKTLCIHFDQDKGIISEHCYYDIKATSQWTEISSTGKYIYNTHTEQKKKLVRIKISDLENGNYNIEVINPTEQVGNENYSSIRIGIDGNIYVRNGKSLMVIYDSETANPRFETLYTGDDIPDPDINFPNYLYTYDLFACNSDCDRNATFSFPDPRNEIIAYEWDFGDGSKSTEITPTHQYSASGNYNVTLKVNLKNGSYKTLPTRKITINNKKPSAKFDNASVCYGEPLKIILNGEAPFNISYTFNGENKTITTFNTEYLISNIAGRYQITKVTDHFCESEPTLNNTAEILPKLNKLTIKTNND